MLVIKRGMKEQMNDGKEGKNEGMGESVNEGIKVWWKEGMNERNEEMREWVNEGKGGMN